MKIDIRSLVSIAILVFFTTTVILFYKPPLAVVHDNKDGLASTFIPEYDDDKPVDDTDSNPEVWWYRDFRAPDWVNDHNVSHLFDWTWRQNGGVLKSGIDSIVSNPVYTPFDDDEHRAIVVNDVLRHLYKNPDQGILIDEFTQLSNTVPHELPRYTEDYRDNYLCHKLNIRDKWLACMMSAIELSEAMPYTRKFVTVGIYNAFIDYGSCNDQVPGTVFTNHATYHFQRWTNSPCFNSVITNTKNIQSHDALIDPLGVYGTAYGHYPNQQFPRLLRLLATAPQDTKVLTPVDGIAGQLLDILIEKRIITKDRIIPVQRDVTYHAKIVYRSEACPYLKGDEYGNYLHDRTDMELVHKVMMTNPYDNNSSSDKERNYIVVIKRDHGSRYLENMDEMIKTIEAIKPDGAEIVYFTGEGHIREHMKLFNRAYMVIGVHGAGFINMMWCKPGTYILEIGYDKGMSMPSMYYEMATHSDHIYRLVDGTGDYSGNVNVNLTDLTIVLYTEHLRVIKTRVVSRIKGRQ